MNTTLKSMAIALGVAVTIPVWAGPQEDAIKKAIEPLMQGVPVNSISKTKLAELYEVDTPRGIVYTDKAGSFVIFSGTVVDTKSKVNLTEQRMNQLGAFKFSDLPLGDAIKTVHGNGSRTLVTFEDPNCGYCRKLAPELVKLKNVTVYTFLMPVLGEDSVNKSTAIWCAKDRSSVWNEFMLNGKAIPTHPGCDNPLQRNYALGQKLRINGTPAILFPTGERIPGAAPAEQIELKLSSAKP